MKIQDFIITANEVWANVRQMHHLTYSNPEHLELGDFYDKWAELTDTFTETYYGKYGRAQAAGLIQLQGPPTDLQAYMKGLRDTVWEAHNTLTAPEDIDLRNILADMTQLINHTAYRLTQK
jgi:hypothetical protein